MLVILWLNEHRILVVAMLGVMMWTGAYAYYFKQQFRGFFMRGRPHNWSVDMVTKKAVARGREQVE